MAASYVTLVLDLYDGSGQPVTSGYAQLVPSAVLTDVPDQMVVPPAPVTAEFRPGVSPEVTLLASDSAGPQPAGWSWTVKPQVPGGLAAWSVFTPAGPAAFTGTSGTPCVLTWTAGGEAYQLQSLPDGTAVQLSGDSLPGGFQAGATYFVVNSTGDTVQLAAVAGGAPLASASAGSGELTVTRWHLSALAPVQAAAAVSGYLPLPSGTASAGTVPVATGNGNGSAWAALTAADVGADASGAAAAAQAASVPLPAAAPASAAQVLSVSQVSPLETAWADQSGGSSSYTSGAIGDGTSATLTVTHGLGTQYPAVAVWDISGASPVLVIPGSVTATSADAVQLGFGAAPAAGSLKCTVVG